MCVRVCGTSPLPRPTTRYCIVSYRVVGRGSGLVPKPEIGFSPIAKQTLSFGNLQLAGVYPRQSSITRETSAQFGTASGNAPGASITKRPRLKAIWSNVASLPARRATA